METDEKLYAPAQVIVAEWLQGNELRWTVLEFELSLEEHLVLDTFQTAPGTGFFLCGC